MKNIVMLDLGETLVQYLGASPFSTVLGDAIAGVADYLRANGIPLPPAEQIQITVAEENFEAADYKVRPLEERLARIFQIGKNPKLDEVRFEMCKHFMKPIFSLSQLYEDSVPALNRIRSLGFRTIIVSNTTWGSPAELWREEVRKHNLHDYVDDIVFCRDAGWRKPAPQVFRYALDKMGASPAQCVFVGDNVKWDVEGPRAVGLSAVLIDRHGKSGNSDENIITTLHELVDLLVQ